MTKNETITVLHLFESYLPTAANWAYRMITNLPNSSLAVAAYNYQNQAFQSPRIKFLMPPDWVSEHLIEGYSQNINNVVFRSLKKIRNRNHNLRFLELIGVKAKEWNIDLIHCHFANMGWQYLRLKEITNLPFVISFYGFDYESLPFMFKVWEKRYNELFRKADLFICEGQHGASILRAKGCPASKIKLVPLGVEVDKLPFVPRLKKENELNLLQLCNFTQKKGHIYSALAFVKAIKKCPNMTLTFVGKESQSFMPEIKKILLEQKCLDKFNHIENIEFAQLYIFMNQYQVFIHPSCYADNRDCEGGAPVVLLDAEGIGMPVISTTHCDIPSEVIHRKTGLLSKEKDVLALSQSIEYFYKMGDNEYQQFSINARKHIEKNFDIRKCASLLEQVYRNVLAI